MCLYENSPGSTPSAKYNAVYLRALGQTPGDLRHRLAHERTSQAPHTAHDTPRPPKPGSAAPVPPTTLGKSARLLLSRDACNSTSVCLHQPAPSLRGVLLREAPGGACPGTYYIGTPVVYGSGRAFPGTYTIGTRRVYGAERLPGTCTINTPRVYGAERLPET